MIRSTSNTSTRGVTLILGGARPSFLVAMPSDSSGVPCAILYQAAGQPSVTGNSLLDVKDNSGRVHVSPHPHSTAGHPQCYLRSKRVLMGMGMPPPEQPSLFRTRARSFQSLRLGSRLLLLRPSRT